MDNRKKKKKILQSNCIERCCFIALLKRPTISGCRYFKILVTVISLKFLFIIYGKKKKKRNNMCIDFVASEEIGIIITKIVWEENFAQSTCGSQ